MDPLTYRALLQAVKRATELGEREIGLKHGIEDLSIYCPASIRAEMEIALSKTRAELDSEIKETEG